MFLNTKTKGGDAVKQPKGLNNKLLVFKQEVRVAEDIQRDCPAWLLLWVQRTALFCHLKSHKTKQNFIKMSLCGSRTKPRASNMKQAEHTQDMQHCCSFQPQKGLLAKKNSVQVFICV